MGAVPTGTGDVNNVVKPKPKLVPVMVYAETALISGSAKYRYLQLE
jgi:hypothetical protein